ncbi:MULTISPECIES: glutaredoxin family protein [Bacillaceae]|uniref:glutaredoxin family protein n=1 Tax=Bacillaceae TaxID=186817 RepID=UPI001BDDE6AF|nr:MULTISPECIES: glutaredoxin family protein [Bacillaceae]MDX8362513.1 glutaredoxin family protein [Cytobacillus sp. IB215316]
MTTVLYTMDGCSSCQYTRSFLRKKNIPFTEKNIFHHKEYLLELQQLINEITLPILHLDDKVIIGKDILKMFPTT